MPDIFNYYTLPLDSWIATGVNWVVAHWRPFFLAIKWPVDQVLTNLDSFLNFLPPLVFLVLLFLIAWRIAGSRIGLFSVASMAFIGFLGLWDETMTTLAMVLSAVIFCAVVGIPIGILSAKSDRFEAIIRPFLDAMQTTPAFVYLVPVVMLFRIGTVPGVIATIIFSLPPTIRLTSLGIRQVQREVVEASYAFGATSSQTLWEIQFPLALRTIMTGINQTLMLSLSMVVIAALIGAGGLGLPVFEGLNALKVGLAGIGGISIVLLAIVLDRITQALGSPKKNHSKSLIEIFSSFLKGLRPVESKAGSRNSGM